MGVKDQIEGIAKTASSNYEKLVELKGLLIELIEDKKKTEKELEGTKKMLKRAQEIGTRDALIIHNIQIAMIGEEGEWVDLIRAFINPEIVK